MAPGWPAYLSEGPVGLRPIRRRDAAEWRAVRSANVEWLTPWEATPPAGTDTGNLTFRGMVGYLRAEARAGRLLPFVVTYEDRLVGQLTVGGIAWGSLASAHIGYWVDSRWAGRGIIPTAVALAVDHSLFTVGLHRIEINIRPENAASLRVVEKLGLREEGLRQRLLHIDGAWRDHRSFAVTTEEVPGGLLTRWLSQQSQQ
jgi:ribosomal-protein-alanine N-acetyltransferase